MDKTERINNIKNGIGVQNLISEAYAILGNPILLHDMEYKTIDINKGVVTDDPIWNEYATKGTVGYEWLDFFKNECFIEAAANTKKITFLISDKLKYDRIFGKLFNKNNIQIGCAVMLACEKPFEQDDPVLFETVCQLLSVELGHTDFYIDYGQKYFEKLVDELIAGVNDLALYTAHVESIYMHLKSNLYLAVIDIGKRDPTYAELEYYRKLFSRTQPEYIYAVYAKHILVIMGIDGKRLYAEKDMNRLNRLFHTNDIYAGVSSSFENLFELNKYYKEALEILCNAQKFAEQRIYLYELFNDANDE